MARLFILLAALSQLSGCAWMVAVGNRGQSYDCYDGLETEYQLAQFIGPFALIDLPFTLVADTASLPFCWL
ncbi:YceK/YidQ family lipoprotein [Pseudomonas tructae]|uniref:YceK/YidQ family lipoprotein n=1 Tax=Pseudomonas tructae TaxID=2518644 RepID=A0A411MK18_9PSED|nr:YceK/YidQ family lipoprotein [Pseudomonas tructae]QBF27131.1 YceK/YidQ family lipoprotein [Pseudomonas tructae]